MLCAGGSISMSTRLLRWALLTGLAFAVPTLGPTIAEAQVDVPDAANLYPGRYAAVCTPGPIFGCVCVIDSSGEALMFTELDSMADHHLKDVADSEYLRMISWLRGPAHRSATARSVAAEGRGHSKSATCRALGCYWPRQTTKTCKHASNASDRALSC